MRNYELEKELRRVAKQTAVISEERKHRNIEALMQIELPVQRTGDWRDFTISQIGFLNKHVLVCYIIWAICFWGVMRHGAFLQLTNEMLCLLSMAPPLLLLLTVEQVTRVYQRSMLEIEYATKYSLRKLVMMRLLILSIANGIMVLIGILVAKQQLELRLAEVFLYGMTPLILMSCILLWVMRYLQGEKLKYAAFIIYAMGTLAIWIGRMERFNIYAQKARGIWGVLLIGGLVCLILQVRGLMKHLNNFEQVMEA